MTDQKYIRVEEAQDLISNGAGTPIQKLFAAACVAAMPTYTPADILAGLWVPVTPKTMPEERGYPPVNCCHIEDGWSDAAIVTDAGRFINSDGLEIYPTHWAPLPPPLPAPPKEATI